MIQSKPLLACEKKKKWCSNFFFVRSFWISGAIRGTTINSVKWKQNGMRSAVCVLGIMNCFSIRFFCDTEVNGGGGGGGSASLEALRELLGTTIEDIQLCLVYIRFAWNRRWRLIAQRQRCCHRCRHQNTITPHQNEMPMQIFSPQSLLWRPDGAKSVQVFCKMPNKPSREPNWCHRDFYDGWTVRQRALIVNFILCDIKW